MTQRERRIFVYTPPRDQEPDQQPESGPEPGPVRRWLFSPIGMVCAWILTIGLIMPVALLVLVSLREQYTVLLYGFGLWLTLGLIVIHWWIPSANENHPRTEGIAAAGWHLALTVAASGLAAWMFLFGDDLTLTFTLADTRPVIASAGLSTAVFGVLVLWARGHTPERTLRYTVVSASVLTVWMSLWLVAAHGGL